MKFYVASAFSNKEEVRETMKLLTEAGHTITFDWTVYSDADVPESEKPAFHKLCAEKDRQGVVDADAIFTINHGKGRGMFWETGIADGLGKPIFFVFPYRTPNIFMTLDNVLRFNDIPSAIDFIRASDWDDRLTRAFFNGNVMGVNLEILKERQKQQAKWGQQDNANGTGGANWELEAQVAKRITDENHKSGHLTYLDVLREEVYEAFAESDPVKLRNELVQCAAVCVAWIEAIDRRAKKAPDGPPSE